MEKPTSYQHKGESFYDKINPATLITTYRKSFIDNFLILKNYYKIFIIAILLLCVGFSVYLLFVHLGHSPLENWDEAFYGESTKEMLQTKDIVALHWDYKIWFDKPPMYIWISAIFSLFLGLSELSVRLPSAISALFIIIITSVYAYKKYSLLPSLLTFFTLTLNNVFIWRARSGNIDLFVSLLILLSYFLLLSKNKYRYILLGLIFSLIYLTKTSLVAFPIIIFIANEVFFQRRNLKQNLKEYAKLLLIFIGLSGIWLSLGYLEAGSRFVSYFLFQSDQGVATLTNFNIHYLQHVYYALQRRFFWLFLLGIILAIWNIRKQQYFLLITYSCLLLLQLSFTARDNNWYLIPSMPFWSIIIGFTVYSILKLLKGRRYLYLGTSIVFIVLSTYIFYKTFSINILPILNSSSTTEQARSAKAINLLSKPNDTIVRLDPLISTTLYYDNRYTLACSSDTSTHDYWINTKDLTIAIKDKKIQWLVGTNSDVDAFYKIFNQAQFQKIKVNNQEIILKVK